MLIKSIIYIITIIFFLTSIQSGFSKELIIPLKKPKLSIETSNNNLNDNSIYPKKKPQLVKKSKIEKIDAEISKNRIVKINGIIIPKNKPLIVKKQRARVTKKSRYYSDRDINYARQAIKFMEKGNWRDAKRVAKKARAKSIYDFILWRHLLTTGNKATFIEYKSFIEKVKNYPRLDRIKYLAEHKISNKNQSPNEIINWFNIHKPLSGFGEMILGESYLLIGKKDKGIDLIKKGFVRADLSKNDLKYFRKKFKKYLNNKDYIDRADYLAWENKYWDLKRTIRYLPKDYQLLYTARQLLMSKSYGVDTAIKRVPDKLKNDAGLNYDRLKWRRKRGRVDSCLEILLNIKNNIDYMVSPDKLWIE